MTTVKVKSTKDGILAKIKNQVLNLTKGGENHENWMTTDIIDNSLFYLGKPGTTAIQITMGAGSLSNGTVHTNRSFDAVMALSNAWQTMPKELADYIIQDCCGGIVAIMKRTEEDAAKASAYAAKTEADRALVKELYTICPGVSITPRTFSEEICFSHATKRIFVVVPREQAIATAHDLAKKLAPLPSGKPKPKKRG